MSTFAIINVGGKQYKVTEGQVLSVDKLASFKNKTLTFNEVLLLAIDDQIELGKPLLEKAQVKATFVEDLKDKKIRVVKFKSKSRYLRTTGHRQQKSKIRIEKISL